MEHTPGERIAAIRERRGLTQKELAELADVSVSLVSKTERGEGSPRLETLHKMAIALRVNTSTLTGPDRPEPPEAVPVERWDDVRDALYRPAPPGDEPATEAGVLAVVAGLTAAGGPLAADRYSEVRPFVPALIRDAASLGEDGRLAQARVYNLAGWLLTMTRQWDDAAAAVRLALDAAPDLVEEAAAVNTRLWLLLRQGRLSEAGAFALEWAGEHQPPIMRAPDSHLAAFGKVMMYANNAAVRDNQPGEAQDALKRARAAAVLIGREVALDKSTTRRFGPASVEMIAAENAAIQEKPKLVIEVTSAIPPERLRQVQPATRMRSMLDVASAHIMQKKADPAMDALDAVRVAAPEWLWEQRYARDVVTRLGSLWKRRRPERYRVLADAVQLPY